MDKVYVIDRLENLGKYAGLGTNFAKAIAFLAKGGLESLPVGKNEIDGTNCWANVMAEAELVPLADRRPEVHHAYFDIQIPLSGEEVYGLAAFDPSAEGSFDEAKDIGFYSQAVTPVTVRPGEFAILYPETCAHAPACSLTGPRKIRKIVVKVKKG